MDRAKNSIQTGFAQLDSLVGGGIRRGTVTILASRPAQGKSNLSLDIAFNVARKRIPVAFFYLDMGFTALERRINLRLERTRQIDARPSDKRLSKKNIQRLAHLDIWELPIAFIYNAPSVELIGKGSRSYNGGLIDGQLRTILRKGQDVAVRERRPLGLVIIDQLDNLQGSFRVPTRWHEVDEILKDLKRLAAELNVAIILVSQLPGRPKGHIRTFTPTLTDLERSGLTEHFDNAILLYRERAYRSDPALDAQAQLFVARKPIRAFRQFRIRFDPQTSIFSD